MSVHEATAADLEDWDARAVAGPGGHVLQSRAWAAHWERRGWRPRFFVFDDGFPVLALERPWPLIGGASAYLPRGPVPADADAARTAERADAVAESLAARGVDVVACDPEVPADAGFPRLLAGRGFHPIEEIQPSRHRLALDLPRGDEAGVFAAFAKSTRQRVRGAERAGVIVVRHDREAADHPPDASCPGTEPPREPARAALDRFYGLLEATGERRHFSFGPRDLFVDWWIAALAAGHLVYLEARSEGEPLAGLVLYRHGDRLTTVHSADRADMRRSHPGVLHLLRWRAIQLGDRRRPPRDGPRWRRRARGAAAADRG